MDMQKATAIAVALLVSSVAFAKYEDQYGTDFGSRIRQITQGTDFKVVWGRNKNAYEFNSLMMYDSKVDSLIEVIEHVRDWRKDPTLLQRFPDLRPAPSRPSGRYNYVSPLGNKVVFCIRGFPDPFGQSHGGGVEAWVFDFGDGALNSLQPVPAEATGANCYVLCVGLDPNTNKQWAYYTNTYDTGKMLRRFNIDDPSEDQFVVDRDPGRYGYRHFAGVSADLNEMVVSHQDGALYYNFADATTAADSAKAINLKNQPGGEPVGTCNIGFSPDAEKNALWIGNYNYGTGNTQGGPHSAIAVNKNILDVSTRKDLLVPNNPDFLLQMQADPNLAVNTAICTQWAFDREACRVGTYVAWYDCYNRCDRRPRATAMRFNAELTEIADFEQFIPADKDNLNVKESRPHMWIYQNTVANATELRLAAPGQYEIIQAPRSIAISFSSPATIEAKIASPKGAVIAASTETSSTNLVINHPKLTAGMYILTIKANGQSRNEIIVKQ
ncbi:MAG: hypothetical protein GF398_21510 [Chitinivibrionales bacterium]|nr:hypothetical protein [Chitinivibrionales bacterium]